MRTATRLLGLTAYSLALSGLLGCQEDNERGVITDSAGKTGVDPKAPKTYEGLQPKPQVNAQPPAGVKPDAPKAGSGGAGSGTSK
jgi:hypothetical protein